MLEPVEFSAYHGGARKKDEGLIDFSASLNPYPPEWLDEIFERARKISDRYPYYEELEEGLSELVGEPVTVTAGITEALYLIGVLALRGRSVIIPKHTYGEYERVARIFGAKVIRGPNDPERLSQLVENGTVVFFCNPNNPDGKFYRVRELGPLIDAVEDKNALLVLDEAFIDFVERPESPEGENIVKLRTFTKSYGLPGIRIGYILGFPEAFKSVRMPWAIGSTGLAFLEFLLEERFEHLKRTMPLIWKEKRRIEKALEVRSDANFFIKYVGDAKNAVKELKRMGVLVRDCTSFGLPEYVRFSVRRPEENDVLIRAFLEALP
ncbi:aminotransferase class I/II-fold pyridoxal phosphate-dependent enzyme [Thermococcus stetteri]|uniref:aminotransferase class I/II-fold pyridoxal phosphate-dependent enzyme n=1 Tax=Thermococcus stetteri TaxID=49900 RepID=UPI001AE66D1C|nr:aminotransferase class I/II-fold pyridoxal phosphate-dependent enzyme [Thermococcus stetteri]MBP1912607.1 histidinol-phosphate aminotransferase [Thermococcus stetteri]